MDQSFGVKPFRFATEFAPVPPDMQDIPGESVLAIAAIRAEMEALRADHAVELAKARSEAYLKALEEVREEREQALLAATDALHAEWEEFADRRDAMIERLRGDACRLAHAIGEALAARALAETPVEAIDQAIGRALAEIARGQEVLICVNPGLIEDVQARIAHRQSLDRRRLNLVVQGDEALPPGDAHLRWDGGGLRLDARARAEAVVAEMEAMGAGK